MSRHSVQHLQYKRAPFRPVSVFPPTAAAAIRRSAWRITATLLAMLVLLTAMAVMSPRAFPQMPPESPTIQQNLERPLEDPSLAATPALRHHPVEQQRQALAAVKLFGAGIVLLIGLRLLAETPRVRVLRV